MDLDDYKDVWQGLDDSVKSGVEADAVVATCRKRVKRFRVGLLVSDILEIGVGLVMVWVWLSPFNKVFSGHELLMSLGAGAIFFVCVFLAVARVLRHLRERRPFVSVSDGLLRQLYAVNQRIWLLRNLIWWYLTPCAIAILTVLIAVGTEVRKSHVTLAASGVDVKRNFFIGEGIYVFCCILVFVGVYYLNQRAVRKELLPLKENLEQLVRDIENGSQDKAGEI